MYQSEYSLILYPTDCNISLSQELLICSLNDLELLGKQESAERYQVGESFLSLFCFMGCSPNIELFPQSDEQPYCYIEIPETSSLTQCLISKNPKTPRCPHCKAGLVDLAKQLKEKCVLEANCSTCSESIKPATLNWRKTAVFAKSFIRIGNIYDAEAIPESQLLDSLKQSTGVAWLYSYIRS